MEDVVLHHRCGSVDRLSSLVEKTEKLLEPFTCRTPPVFNPWFPTSSADCRRPIRPAKPAPCINLTRDFLTVTSQNDIIDHKVCTETTKDILCVSEAPNHLLPVRETTSSPGKPPQTDGDVPGIRRSWSVFTHRRVLMKNSLSRQFDHMVSVHNLHLHQRAKWVITEDNCRDIEQVWRSLSRSVQSFRLPTCNANIQRERAEIWVFCDLLFSEEVGHFLKDELRLSGRISLSVHKLGNVFSL